LPPYVTSSRCQVRKVRARTHVLTGGLSEDTVSASRKAHYDQGCGAAKDGGSYVSSPSSSLGIPVFRPIAANRWAPKLELGSQKREPEGLPSLPPKPRLKFEQIPEKPPLTRLGKFHILGPSRVKRRVAQGWAANGNCEVPRLEGMHLGHARACVCDPRSARPETRKSLGALRV
jgi:hypothetical protein